jgi:sugar lactone lactonase YvrE
MTWQSLRITVFSLLALIAAAITACNLRPTAVPLRLAGATPQLTGTVAAPEAAPRATLTITIKWPERDYPGFRAALIPLTTNSLVIKARAGATLLGEATIERKPGEATASAKLDVDAASNVSVEVKAYREATPDADSVVIAQGSKAGLSLAPSKTIDVLIRLVPTFVPAVTALSANVGVAGDKIVLFGKNFGDPGTPVSVSFNGATASATLVSTSSIDATVPQGVTSGPIAVKADGVPAEPTATFWIPRAMELAGPPKAAWDHTPAATRLVLFGNTLAFSATPSFEVANGQDPGALGAPPPASYSVDAAAGTISAAGVLTAGQAFKAGTVTAHLRTARATLSVSVQDVTLSLNSPSIRLLGRFGTDSVPFSAVHTFSDGATAGFVDFESADAAKVSVTQGGVASTANADANATVTVTALSKIASTRTATSFVTLKNLFTRVESVAGGVPNADGTGLSAAFRDPRYLTGDSDGNIYVSDYYSFVVRKITPAGVVTTYGSGKHGGDDGPANVATFYAPRGMAADNLGSLYVTECELHAIRKINLSTGVVSTLAGNPLVSGFVDGTGSAAKFNCPTDITYAGGDLFVLDNGNRAIRKLTLAGVVSTLAGNGAAGSQDGTGDGARFDNPWAIAAAPGPSLVVSDRGNRRIRSVTLSGVVTTRAMPDGKTIEGFGLTTLPSGDILVCAENTIMKLTPAGGLSYYIPSGLGMVDGVLANARAHGPQGIWADPSGIVYFADLNNRRVRKVVGSTVSTIAGDGRADGPAATARFNYPVGVSLDPAGNLLVGDNTNNRIRRISPAGIVSTLSGGDTYAYQDGPIGTSLLARPWKPVADASGNVYLAEHGNGQVRKITPDGITTHVAGTGDSGLVDGAARSARFATPHGLAFAPDGALIVADSGNSAIRRIKDGTVSTLAGSPAGQAGYADGVRDVARFNYPDGVAVGPDGTIYIADTYNKRVRKLAADGTVSTLAGGSDGEADGQGAAAQFGFVSDVAVTPRGDLFVIDRSYGSVRLIDPNGKVTTIAGGNQRKLGTQFFQPNGLWFGADGNIYVADSFNHAIMVVK